MNLNITWRIYNHEKQKTIQLILTLLTLLLVNVSVQAQVYLMPLNKPADDYVEYQGNKIPVLESMSTGNVCLFDQQWCKKDQPSLASSYTYDGGFDPRMKLIVVDSQLVLIKKEQLTINNGFGKFKNINNHVDNTLFKFTNYTDLANILKLKSLPILTYAANDEINATDTSIVLLNDTQEPSEDMFMSYEGEAKWVRRVDVPRLLDIVLKVDEFGKTTNLEIDGVMTKMPKLMAQLLAGIAREIEIK